MHASRSCAAGRFRGSARRASGRGWGCRSSCLLRVFRLACRLERVDEHPRVRLPRVAALGVDLVPHSLVRELVRWSDDRAGAITPNVNAFGLHTLRARFRLGDVLQPLNANVGDFEPEPRRPAGHMEGGTPRSEAFAFGIQTPTESRLVDWTSPRMTIARRVDATLRSSVHRPSLFDVEDVAGPVR